MVIASAALALVAAGCGRDARANPELTRNWPAAVAGGACQLLDYDTIAATVGTRFDTSGAAEKGETFTCALTTAGVDFPDLTLSVTALTVDPTIFTETVVPRGGTKVTGLGKAAYRVRLPAAGRSGFRLEVGWLSANQRLMVLRYSFPPRVAAAKVDALAPKLVELAKKVDRVKADVTEEPDPSPSPKPSPS
jgi:hypothetical protein